MKRLIPIWCLLFLTSCGTTAPSSSSSSSSSSASLPSSSSSSSSIAPDSSSESSSESQSSSESSSHVSSESSEESVSSSESSSSASESSSSVPSGGKISLHDENSHLYLFDDTDEKNPLLKTYRHVDYDDVPYVDFDEFQKASRRYDASLKEFSFSKLSDGRFDLASSFGGHCYLDPKLQTVELVEPDALYGDFSKPNNGIYLDPILDYKWLTGSEKTKYLTKGEKTTYDLSKYQMAIVAEESRLYVPFSLASHLCINPYMAALTYNGRDYYSAKLLGAENNIVRAYSGKAGFLWSYAGTPQSNIHFARTAPKEGESYRFEGEMTDMKGAKTPVAASFKSDKSLSIKSEDLMETVDITGTWSEKDEMITANFISDSILSGSTKIQHIDLSDRTVYRKSTRSEAMAKANYYQLCMDFDYQYGLKNFLGINSFDSEFSRLGCRADLLSTNLETYQSALCRFLVGGKMGDNHYSFVCEGFNSLHPGASIAGEYAKYGGERIDRYIEGNSRASAAKSKLDKLVLNISGSTAVISFSSFTVGLSDPFSGIDSYVVPQGTADVDAFLNTEMNKNVINGICYTLNEVKKNPDIKNICFDVGVNRGGYVMLVPFISAVMTDDPSVIYENSMTGSRVEGHYKADLNNDGVFGGEGDTWKGKYNFYIIQAGGSFSAGNIFPTAAKNAGYATTIGEATAGGGCGVCRRTDLTGVYFQYNGSIGFPEKKSDGTFINSEVGVDPNIAMDINDVYDMAKLNAKLQELK